MAKALSRDEQIRLAESLLNSAGHADESGAISDEDFAEWQKEAGEPEPGYDEWFRKGVEAALADTSPGIPHEEAMRQFHNAIQRARKLKRSA